MSLTKCQCSKCDCEYGTEHGICWNCMENKHHITKGGNENE